MNIKICGADCLPCCSRSAAIIALLRHGYTLKYPCDYRKNLRNISFAYCMSYVLLLSRRAANVCDDFSFYQFESALIFFRPDLRLVVLHRLRLTRFRPTLCSSTTTTPVTTHLHSLAPQKKNRCVTSSFSSFHPGRSECSPPTRDPRVRRWRQS